MDVRAITEKAFLEEWRRLGGTKRIITKKDGISTFYRIPEQELITQIDKVFNLDNVENTILLEHNRLHTNAEKTKQERYDRQNLTILAKQFAQFLHESSDGAANLSESTLIEAQDKLKGLRACSVYPCR